MVSSSIQLSDSPQLIRIATRHSALAMWQSKHVAQTIQKYHPEVSIELVPIKTQGDKILDVPLAKIGGKGLFVKELEQAMLEGRADIAVHSMKDVPMSLPENLSIVVMGQRACPWDALVGSYAEIEDIPQGAKVGTSSLRRKVQLLDARPDLKVVSLRGNVNTRLRKLDEGQMDAIILAAAGLDRLEMSRRISGHLSYSKGWLPAVAQGVVGIECRTDDQKTQAYLRCFGDAESTLTTIAERSLNRCLEGGCQVPIGGYAQWVDSSHLRLDALVGDAAGTIVRAQDTFEIDRSVSLGEAEFPFSLKRADLLGKAVAEKLLALGAAALLARARQFYQE